MKTASTVQMKEIDRVAIEEHGIPSLDLMETAAQHVTDAVVELLKENRNARITVFCGTGNNGGDGLAAARQLMNQGIMSTVFLVGNPEHRTKDSLANTEALEVAGGTVLLYMGQPVPDCDCIIDALFGVGLNREISGVYREAIEAINAAEKPVIACDIPSGINGDSGEICGIAVKAYQTITFSCAKPGLLKKPGSDYAGEVLVKGIGIPEEIIDSIIRGEGQ